MDRRAAYHLAIERRRHFRLPGYASLADAGFDGPWVSPIQITSGKLDGPLLIVKNWFDEPSARASREMLLQTGYMPGIPFNRVIDKALALMNLRREDVYITQAFHLLTHTRSQAIPAAHVQASFDAVTRYEFFGRRAVALGSDAEAACRRSGLPFVAAIHPSARGISEAARAEAVSAAIEKVL